MTPGETSQAGLVASGTSRDGLELLFEVLLETGADLMAPVVTEVIEGVEVFVVGSLVACFEEKVTASLVEALVERQPRQVVLLDAAFAGDAERLNAEGVFAGAGVELVVR